MKTPSPEMLHISTSDIRETVRQIFCFEREESHSLFYWKTALAEISFLKDLLCTAGYHVSDISDYLDDQYDRCFDKICTLETVEVRK